MKRKREKGKELSTEWEHVAVSAAPGRLPLCGAGGVAEAGAKSPILHTEGLCAQPWGHAVPGQQMGL